MANNGVISLSKASLEGGSGYFTVASKATSVQSAGYKASYEGTTITLTSHATVGVVNDTKETWTIKLGGGEGSQASIKGSDTVFGSASGDSVSIGGTDVHLELGGGADSVVSAASMDGAYVDAGAGDDSITVTGNQVTVYGGTGADSISVAGNDAYVDGGAGNDSISVVGEGGEIHAGAGDDSVYASLKGGLVYLDDGADYAEIDGEEATVYAGKGNDSVSIGGKNATVYGGEGNDSLLAAGEGEYVYGEAGNDAISIGGARVTADGGDGNDTILVAGTAANVTAGIGNDVISIGATGATIDAGAGNDSIVVAAGDATTITLGDGKDTVSIGATGVSLQDYTYGTDKIVLGGGLGATKAGDNVTLSTDGVISGDKVGVQIAATNGAYKAELSKNEGKSQKYAWVGSEATTIDLSSEVDNFYVQADLNDTQGDVITGGRGADSIIVGANDTVNGGRGDDSISIASGATGVVVGLSANGGNDTINGASVSASDEMFGFDESDITLYVDDASKLGFTFGGMSNALKASVKGASAEFTGAASAKGAGVDLKVNVAGTTTNYEIIADEAEIDDGASYIYGVGEKVSLNGTSGVTSTVVDLSNTHYFGDARTYEGIDVIDFTESTGEDILISSTEEATAIHTGKGNTTVFGVGKYGDEITAGEGNDTIVYGTGYGKDTVKSYDGENDTLYFLQGTTNFTKDSKALTMAVGEDSLTVLNSMSGAAAADETYTFQVYGEGAFKAKVALTDTASTLTYDDEAIGYYGGNKTDTLAIAEGDKDNHEIWIGGSWAGKNYSSIEVYDGTKAEGDNLVFGGTDTNDTLKAGKGEDTLYGGFGAAGNDILYSGTGATTFEFGLGDGSDTIKSSKDTDSIYLWNVSSTDIDYEKTVAGSTERKMSLVLTDGSTLTVDRFSASKNMTFVLGSDQSKWTYDAKNSTFKAVEA